MLLNRHFRALSRWLCSGWLFAGTGEEALCGALGAVNDLWVASCRAEGEGSFDEQCDCIDRPVGIDTFGPYQVCDELTAGIGMRADDRAHGMVFGMHLQPTIEESAALKRRLGENAGEHPEQGLYRAGAPRYFALHGTTQPGDSRTVTGFECRGHELIFRPEMLIQGALGYAGSLDYRIDSGCINSIRVCQLCGSFQQPNAC